MPNDVVKTMVKLVHLAKGKSAQIYRGYVQLSHPDEMSRHYDNLETKNCSLLNLGWNVFVSLTHKHNMLA